MVSTEYLIRKYGRVKFFGKFYKQNIYAKFSLKHSILLVIESNKPIYNNTNMGLAVFTMS